MPSSREQLAQKMADKVKRDKEADPHGFHDMSEKELIDWMGAGNAEPGSITYNHARLVLESKQNHRLLHHGLDSEPTGPREPDENPMPPINGALLTFLGLVIAAGVAVGAVVPSTTGRPVIVLAVVAVVGAVLVVPAARYRMSGWLDRTFG